MRVEAARCDRDARDRWDNCDRSVRTGEEQCGQRAGGDDRFERRALERNGWARHKREHPECECAQDDHRCVRVGLEDQRAVDELRRGEREEPCRLTERPFSCAVPARSERVECSAESNDKD